jgi:flagellar biosynthetic protein FlhB
MEQREDKSFDDKTEDATEERRHQFREEGNLANPREIVGAITLILFTLYFYFFSKDIIYCFRLGFERSWKGFPGYFVNFPGILKIIYYVASPVFFHIVFIFFICIIFPTLGGLVITKFNWSWKKINFDFNKINFFSGIKKIFNVFFLIEFFKVFLKCFILSLLIIAVLKIEIFTSGKNYFFSNVIFMKELGKSLFQLLFIMSIASFFLGVMDFWYNYWKINRDMKMTKQELKEEVKKHEGDPLLKSQRKRIARDIVLRKSLKEVEKATFIVTNPDHFSVAVRYVKGMRAPTIVAKGQDLIAFRIKEIAKQKDIMIVENKPLARALYKTVKIGQEIPSSLYQAVIEVIKYIYQIHGKKYFEKFEV